MKKLLVIALSLTLGGLGACDSETIDTQPDCPGSLADGQPWMTGTATLPPLPDALRDGSLVLSGTAFHNNGLAIRQVVVAGKAATNEGFNWDRWTVDVPYESLVSLLELDPNADPATDDAVVTLAVEGTDACGFRQTLTTVDVLVDPTPGVWINRLSLDFDFPDGAETLTEGDARPATVTVSANPAAAGANISISATAGALRGLTGVGEEGVGIVTLSGDGSADATATLLFEGAPAGDVTINAFAQTVVASRAFKVLPAEPDIVVDTLDLQVLLPKGQNYLPEDGSQPAQVKVIGSPQAVGASVNLSATTGTFLDSGSNETSVVLAGGAGDGTASATVLFYGDARGVVLLTAETADRVASATLNVVGAPSPVPVTGSIAAGQTLAVTVFTDGVVDFCQASPLFGVSVTSGEFDLMAEPGVGPGDPAAIIISVDADLTEDVGDLTISCTDVFGQSASGTYAIIPDDGF